MQDIALFNGISQRMGHLTVQQRIISQNISQADTPNYKAREVSQPNFKRTMSRYMGDLSLSGPKQKVPIGQTSPGHMIKKMHVGRKDKGEESRETYEVKPSKNAVVIEEQMMKSSKTAMNYELMTNLYRKHHSMLRRAMTSSGQ